MKILYNSGGDARDTEKGKKRVSSNELNRNAKDKEDENAESDENI